MQPIEPHTRERKDAAMIRGMGGPRCSGTGAGAPGKRAHEPSLLPSAEASVAASRPVPVPTSAPASSPLAAGDERNAHAAEPEGSTTVSQLEACSIAATHL